MEEDHVWVKFDCKDVDPCENSRAVHISPHSSGTVIDNEKSSIKATSLWAFQRAINQSRASPLTSSKWGSGTQICHFRSNLDKKH